ncbi:MAG TPA: type VI secretion system tube protein Hcp [Steroidobacteraceae bacterium]|nr:type VI secretion system tube protein Hcp [Steroidobacteraceae bacterium]
MAAADYFLKLDGITSESRDDKHKGEIEIASFSWGESNAGTAGFGGGQGAGKVAAGDFTFVKRFDKASPQLFIACATGSHYKTGTLTVRKAGGGQQEYLKFNFEEVFISSYNVAGGGGGGTDSVPMDTFSINFASLEVIYKEQKADGTLGGEAKQKYNFAENKKI